MNKKQYKYYKKKLKKTLGKNRKIPKVLKKLIKFDIAAGDNIYVEEFDLYIDEDVIWYHFEANNVDEDNLEILEKKLIPFAINEHCSYAFWLIDDRPTDALPVVRISSDGFVLLEATNIYDFIRLITAGKIFFIFDDDELQDYIDKPLLMKFRKWIKSELNLEPIKSDDDIVQIHKKAEENYYDVFNTWLNKHGYKYPVDKYIPDYSNHIAD